MLGRFYEARAGGYAFECGRRLKSALSAAGYEVVPESLLHDSELSFNGPAESGVFTSW